MHDRPPSRSRQRNALRERRRLAQQRYRKRFDAGRFTVAVEINGDVVEMLISTGWLVEGEGECKAGPGRGHKTADQSGVFQYGTSDDRRKIATAIAAMLAEAAKR